jgi:restriction endonuclease S subunit
LAVVSIVNRSQLEDTLRLDAEYYQQEYLDMESKVVGTSTSVPWGRIGGQFITGPFGSEFIVENYVAGGSYRYVRGQDVKEFFLIDTDNVYIPESDYRRLSKYALTEGDILISVVGTLGNAAIVDKTVPPAIFSCKSTLFRSTTVNPFYLIAYLNCRFGRTLLQRKVRGAVQTGLNIGDLRSLPISIAESPLQDHIGNLVLRAKEQFDGSKTFYSQAENLLLEELGLKDFQPKYELSYTASLSKAFGVHRVDAEYFQPLYEDLMKAVTEKCSLISLGTVFNFNRGIFIPTDYYTDEKTSRPYIRIKELSGHVGFEESKVVFIKDGYPQDKNNELKENDLVVAIIGDTIGKTNRISMELAGGFCSNNMGRLRIKSDWANRILPEFAELAFQSLFIQGQIERGKAQTGQPKISDFEIRAIRVPMPAIETQKRIALLIRQSYETRKKAKELLKEAKSKVENLIEGRAYVDVD